MIVRAATPDDAEALAAIYGWHVLNGVGTFEETPPSADDMAERLATVQARGLPWVVAETGGQVLAFAYAAPFRLRAAYRYAAEDSVYVAPGAERRGLGAATLSAVVEACERFGLRQLIAVIGDSANAGSIGLHAALGFEPAGTLPAVGYKHGRWLDVPLMVKPLNGGGATAPDAEGLAF